MKYVKRDVIVDAVRFAVAKDEKPEVFEKYPVFYEPDIETGVPYLRLATPDGSKRADVGDWVVKSSNGSLRIYTSEEFLRLFEGVNENFSKNSEGFVKAYKEGMKVLKEGGRKKMSASVLVGEVDYKSGEKFRLSLEIDRVEKEKKEEVKKEEPKKEGEK